MTDFYFQYTEANCTSGQWKVNYNHRILLLVPEGLARLCSVITSALFLLRETDLICLNQVEADWRSLYAESIWFNRRRRSRRDRKVLVVSYITALSHSVLFCVSDTEWEPLDISAQQRLIENVLHWSKLKHVSLPVLSLFNKKMSVSLKDTQCLSISSVSWAVTLQPLDHFRQ